MHHFFSEFLFLLLLKGVVEAEHFRAGSLQFKKDENGVVSVTRTVGFRRAVAGWVKPGCDEDDLGQLSGKILSHKNFYLPIGVVDKNDENLANPKLVKYELLQIEKSSSLPVYEHYCYGKTFDEALPAAIAGNNFTMTNGFHNEGWTVFQTHDNGNTGKGKYQYTAHVYEYDNNSPQFELPAIWWILDGCEEQTYYLTPQDPDGDQIICRWSTLEEASFFAHDKEGYSNHDGSITHWPLNQLSLNTTGCSVTYHPEHDNGGGYKPIAVQVEDFDENGNIKSSVPAVFIAQVFTPDMDESLLDSPFTVTNRRKRHGEDYVNDEIIEWNQFKPNIRLQPRNTDHCDGLPLWIPPTPPNESLLIYEATVSYYQVWAARFLFQGMYYTTVHRAQFSLPKGMTCTELREDGTATCNWTPTVEQIGLHTVCGLCYDVFERPSNRNCVKIEVIQKEPPTENPCLTNPKEGMKRFEFTGQNIQKESILLLNELESDFVMFESINSTGAFHDFKVKTYGDRDISDLPRLFDSSPHTFYQFDQACGITESPQRIEIYSIEGGQKNKSRKVLFDFLELTVFGDTLSLPRANLTHYKWDEIQGRTPVFQYNQIYLLVADERIQAFQNPLNPGSFVFKSNSGPVVTSLMTLEFHSKHLKLSKISLNWFECETTGKLNPSVTSGTFVDSEDTTHPMCYRYTGEDNFDEDIYTGEYWNEAILPGFFNPALASHPDRRYNFVVVKKTSGDFADFDEVKNACSKFGMSLVYPYDADANAFWLARLIEQQASTPGLRLMIGLTYTLFSTSSGALVPSESALPITNNTADANGYINFDGLTYHQAFTKMKNNQTQFIMDSSTGKWGAFSSVPAGMDATFCFKTEEITTICGNSLCDSPETAKYECKCPDDGSSPFTEFGIEKCVDPTPPCDVNDPCIAPAVCRDVYDSAFCECPEEGVTQFLSSDGISCEIIDPCSTALHNCRHPSFDCVPTQIAGEYTCENKFECPCDMDCLKPPCIDLTDCFGLGSATWCPEIDCTNVGTYKGQYRCPVGKDGDCVRPDDCEFYCETIGPGWTCLKEKCQAYEDCSFECLRIEHKGCPGGQECKNNEDCCPVCGHHSGMDKFLSFRFL